MNRDYLTLLAIHRVPFINTAAKLKIYRYCLSVGEFPSTSEIEGLTGSKLPIGHTSETFLYLARKDLSRVIKTGGGILFIEDSRFPRLMKEIYNPPFLLFYRGTPVESDTLHISVAGTRRATGRALKEAYAVSFDLARSGVAVVSGLAEGVDSAAHRGALAGKGYTAAFLGSGIDVIYPECNKKLAQSIIESGGILFSEYPPGSQPEKHHFPERNRLISAVSEALVLAETPGKSGALITADFALEQGREVFVLQDMSCWQSGEGTLKLLREGASSVSCASELLHCLSYKTGNLKKRINIDLSYDSLETGRFLAARFLAELNGREVQRQGVYYRL